MSTSDTGHRGAGDSPVAVTVPPPAPVAEASRAGRRLRVLAGLAGIAGPVMLTAYFTAPVWVGNWPSAAESPGKLAVYATAHRQLFYLGGWLQATGALLSIVFLLFLLQHSGARRTLAGSATLTGCAVLLSVVAVEAAMLEAVPVAAANHDLSTAATGFEFASGVFARIYPLIPAPLVFAGIGIALSQTTILPRAFASTAVAVSGLFLIAGLAAVFGSPGVILAEVMSGVEAIWIAVAAIAYAATTTPAQPAFSQGGRRVSKHSHAISEDTE